MRKELERLAESPTINKEMFFKFRYDYKMGKIERPQLSDFIEEK